VRAPMTPFCFEHDFAAPSAGAIFDAYFDPHHQLEQDRVLGIVQREVIELADRGDELRRVCRIVPSRKLPVVLRPLAGPLDYLETAIWRRRADEIAIEMQLSLARTKITATYRLQERCPGSIHRSYSGDVSVDVALLAARIERSIVAEFERSVPLAAACTQSW